jgi:acyl carrier protein
MLIAPTPAQIESTVHDKIRAILVARGSHSGRLSGIEKLSATLGLSSLDLAFLVAELETTLGVDPFAKLVSITSIRSVGDLVRAYQKACFPDLMSSEKDDSIPTAVKRAQTRRARGKRR